jgi:hypothetical protein
MRCILLIFLFSPFLLVGQIKMIIKGVDFKVNAQTDIIVRNGGIDNNNSIINNEGTICLDVDFSESGLTSSYVGTGLIWFEGTSNQTISSMNTMVIDNIRIDNGLKVLLGTDLLVSNTLDLSDGQLELGIFDVLFDPSATISNYSNQNFILTNSTGIVSQYVANASTVVFPVGSNALSYTPATLTNSGTDDVFMLKVQDNVYENGTSGAVLTNHVVDKTWLINQMGAGADVEVQLGWNTADELGTFDRDFCAVSRHIGGTIWDNPPLLDFIAASPVGTASFERSRSGFTDFSSFIVRDLTIILSTEVLTFEAERLNTTTVQLDWSVTSDEKNQGFEIQRMLEHELGFSKVGFVEKKIDGESINNYDFKDLNNDRGTSYYRLKQIGMDGQVSFSVVRAVAGEEQGSAAYIGWISYPNPVDNQLTIEFKNIPPTIQKASYSIISASGQLIHQFDKDIKQAVMHIEYVKKLAPAPYLLSIDLDNGQRIFQKFIKQ